MLSRYYSNEHVPTWFQDRHLPILAHYLEISNGIMTKNYSWLNTGTQRKNNVNGQFNSAYQQASVIHIPLPFFSLLVYHLYYYLLILRKYLIPRLTVTALPQVLISMKWLVWKATYIFPNYIKIYNDFFKRMQLLE